jgi:hypothetical protein
VYPGPVDLDLATGDTCVAGRLDATTDVFGTMLTPSGGFDVWLARLAADGTPRFVRGFGSSTGNETPVGVLATSDGGCLVEVAFQGSLDLGGAVGPVPYQGGGDVLVARFDAVGTAQGASSISGPGAETAAGLVSTGGKTYAVVTINALIVIAGIPLSAAGSDAVVIELADTTPVRVLDVIGGAGDVSIRRVSGHGGEVVVSGGFTGELAAAGTAVTSSTSSGFVVALVP